MISWLSKDLLSELIDVHMSHLMTKLTKWVCAQRRLRSAGAFAQSDQSLRCMPEESLGPYVPIIESTVKTLIRLGGCPGWSESLLGAQLFCWFCHEVAHIIYSGKEIHWKLTLQQKWISTNIRNLFPGKTSFSGQNFLWRKTGYMCKVSICWSVGIIKPH